MSAFAAHWGKLVALAALLCVVFMSSSVRADTLSADCQTQLDALWSNYTNPAYTFNDCDNECLAECKETLEEAIYTTNIKSCPLQADITRCFSYYAPQWEAYIEACDLFTVDSSDLPAGSASEAGAEGSAAPPASPTDAEAEAAAPTDAEAEAAAPTDAGAEAEAAAPTSSDAEAEAEAPSKAEAEEESEAAAPAPAEEDADAEAEAEAGRRRLLAEGEAEAAGSTGSGICFPSFKSTEEFEMYLNGEYFSEAYSAPSDTAGIILSVFFWVGLAAMGLYLRK